MLRALAASLVLGGLLARALYAMHGHRTAIVATEALHVLQGHPYTIAFQSRLLAPGLVFALSRGTGLEWTDAHRAIFILLAAITVPIATLAVGTWTRSPRLGLRYGFVTAGLTLLLQDPFWLHLWDLLDLSLGFVFAYAVFANVAEGWLLALFVVSLANRESALFIPFWLVLSALPTRQRPANVRRLVEGTVAMSLGLGALYWTRRALFAGEAAPHRPMTPWGNHWKLRHNLIDLGSGIVHGYWRSLVVYAALATAALFVWDARARLPEHVARVPLLLAAIGGSIFAFAVVQETRTWLVAVPWLVFVHASRNGGLDNPRLASRPLPPPPSAGSLRSHRSARTFVPSATTESQTRN